ncbi:unnamed protein product [Bursaphelenchus xylophilus]|uniref:(pine wood nematode) hypothetical protein n=1 Tax=Bursaphelenchus xylophilus TaxID=6326 RepID=A0A1I7SM72_BURXY|nr:unnamed protein product [Bursaphelenchus xylophilus]CAG9130020.1 unnamed protein product [Bursaphelenchus xylophilus]
MIAPRARLGTIYLSKSTCLYKNLALEEWLFRNHDLEKSEESVLLWSNTPSVVIGRYQNPWLEANINFCETREINVVRRFSGGGAVFHDLGNLNISVLTNQKRHNRIRNLKLVADQLNALLSTSVELNSRDDLLLPGERKVSGTAARVARGRAYHHLTLLVDTDLTVLSRSLKSPLTSLIVTNATRSVRAKAVGQLNQDVPGITTKEVRDIVIAGFGKQNLETQILEITEDDVINEQKRPGITQTYRQLKSDAWLIEKTPNFTLSLPEGNVLIEKGQLLSSISPTLNVGTFPLNFTV